MYDFLLVINTNLLPILHRFRAFDTSRSKALGLLCIVTNCGEGMDYKVPLLYGPHRMRVVFTARMCGCLFDTRMYGPYVRLSKNAPVRTGRMYGPYVRVHFSTRAVCTGSAYGPLAVFTGRVHGP